MTRGLRPDLSQRVRDAGRGGRSRAYWKPLVLLIWLGAVVMAFGGGLTCATGGLRVGARPPRGRKSPAARRRELSRGSQTFRLLRPSRAVGAPAFAVQPDEVLPDPKLEQRARDISAELRCLVCQNQSIDDSDAPLARDLRLLVRERLKAGDSDAQVKTYLVDRFGEFVLLKPVFAWHTALLWLAPFLVLAAGAAALLAQARRRRAAPVGKRRRLADRRRIYNCTPRDRTGIENASYDDNFVPNREEGDDAHDACA